MKKAFVTGITGQDGAYLAKYLLGRGYKVFGGMRRSSSPNDSRILGLGISDHENLHLIDFDLLDPGSLSRIISGIDPDEIYNLAAQTFVGVSFDQPNLTSQVSGIGFLNILDAVRTAGSNARIYQASTSEMYGLVQEIPQNEMTPFYPRSPYAVAKLYAHWMGVNHRESYGMFVASGILFNHESPLRGLEFVTRKITDFVAQYKLGQSQSLKLGNLSAERDWGYAPEYVEGMHLMLQHEIPDTFVLSTGKTSTVRDFAKWSFEAAGIELKFEGSGLDEVGINSQTGERVISVDSKFFRPSEVEILIGDSSKAKTQLNWEAKTSVQELARIMVEADVARHSLN